MSRSGARSRLPREGRDGPPFPGSSSLASPLPGPAGAEPGALAARPPRQVSAPQGLSMDASKKVDLKIIIIGALGVGKTSLLHQYVHKTFYEDYRTTLGASILTKVLAVDNSPLKLQIWDTGGQERFRSMVSTFYKGSDGCVLAFDVTDRESFEALDNWRDDFLEKVPEETASAWCKEKDIPYFEVSAKNNINVAEAFETLAKQALSRYKGIFESYLTDSIKLTPNDKPKKSCC
ncbi:ras-related protein Rab-7b isoform X3 [Corvus hawaiiensis]|uniref:ras-related protein Rab-7b isoform X3 n=1 Tax=Corvus hawaiiensis TaxID=134902 RepID=UPI002019CD10|nr:ras-related protein Rab-7b isoform X3 [Corvus hawaiiensis]